MAAPPFCSFTAFYERKVSGAYTLIGAKTGGDMSYLRTTMPKKNGSANAVKTRARLVSKRSTKRVSAKKTASRKKPAGKAQPPQKLFHAKEWFGAFPELAGPTVKVQRQMRDEW